MTPLIENVMKHSLSITIAMLAVVMTACTQDDMHDGTNLITFEATTSNTARSQASYSSSNPPAAFTVYAAKSGTSEVYINGDIINKTSNSPVTWESSATRYWPAYTLDFHAHVNGSGFYEYSEGTPRFKDFKPDAEASRQLDLMYAVKTNLSRQTVRLNFRHALAQVTFSAVNNSEYAIEISEVKIGNIHQQATFSFPSQDTDGTDVTGSWSGVESSATAIYSVTFNAKSVTSEKTELTGVNASEGGDGSLLLIPQKVTAWNPENKSDNYIGSYFLVKVKMTDNGNTLAYNDYIAVPVAIDWKPGVRYVYTFRFFKGSNGGYTPDPSNLISILSSIDYDISTEDFIPGEDTATDINGPQSPESQGSISGSGTDAAGEGPES